jgi:hypothetical protein
MADEKSSSTAYHAFSLLLQAVQTAAAVGILVILALLLVQIKKITDPNFVLSIGSSDEFAVRIGENSFGFNSLTPFYVATVTN